MPLSDPSQQSALNSMTTYLNGFGLGTPDMVDFVKNAIINGDTTDTIKLNLVNTPTFKTAFPEYQAAIDAGSPMTTADILNYRTTVTKAMKDANLPPGFYDNPGDFATLISSKLGAPEIVQRIDNGLVQAQQAPQSVRDEFSNWFGANTDGALASFFLDPTKSIPVLQQSLTKAQIGGAGLDYGFNFSQQQAADFTAQGFTGAQARSSFQQASQMKPLAEETAGEQGDLTPEQIATAALAGGQDQTAVQRRQQERSAAFAGGGGATQLSGRQAGLGLGSNAR